MPHSLPLGRVVSVTATELGDTRFGSWYAPGLLINGSNQKSTEFVHVNGNQDVTPNVVGESAFLVRSADVTASGEGVRLEPFHNQQWTMIWGRYGTEVTISHPVAAGWEAFDGYSTKSKKFKAKFGQGNWDLTPQLGSDSGPRVLLSGSASGGGDVFAASRGAYDDWSPFLGKAYGPKSNCRLANPPTYYASFNAEPHRGWTFYEWLGSPSSFSLISLVHPYQCNAVAVSARFVELAELTLNVEFDGDYGAADMACIGVCRPNPGAAFYGATSIVQVSAVAQPGYVFKNWAGTGKAWIEAEEVGGGGAWVVAGGSQNLEGTTESTIYINLSDGGTKPKPKDRELTAVFCPCIHGGTVRNGWLKGDTQLQGRTGYSTYSPNRNACLLWALEKIRQIGESWAANHDYSFEVGQISKAGGGDSSSSNSHENGLDVDVRYLHTNANGEHEAGRFSFGPNDNDTPGPGTFDKTATEELLDLFRSQGVDLIVVDNRTGISGERIIYDNPDKPRVHYDHFHVRFTAP